MKTIAFDAMGNEHGPTEVVPAVIKFLKINPDYKIIIVGDKTKINPLIKVKNSRIKVLDTKGVAKQTDGAFASRKADNSMAKAINLVKEKQADAVLSAGPSGVYLSIATLQLKRIKGLLRPAFMVVMPTTKLHKKFALLDVGANVETHAKYLEQWARLGSIFMQEIQEVNNPRVGIINIGIEETKGMQFHKDAYQTLKVEKELNFIGFVEPRNLMEGIVDVAVTDGYGGNMVLKTLEGAGLSIIGVLKKAIMKKTIRKIGAVFSRGAFKEMRQIFDYRNIGAAWVLGVNGIVLKSHGASDRKAFFGALNEIKRGLENDVLNKFRKISIK